MTAGGRPSPSSFQPSVFAFTTIVFTDNCHTRILCPSVPWSSARSGVNSKPNKKTEEKKNPCNSTVGAQTQGSLPHYLRACSRATDCVTSRKKLTQTPSESDPINLSLPIAPSCLVHRSVYQPCFPRSGELYCSKQAAGTRSTVCTADHRSNDSYTPDPNTRNMPRGGKSSPAAKNKQQFSKLGPEEEEKVEW